MSYSYSSRGANDFQTLLNSLDQFRQDRQETKQAFANRDPSYYEKEIRDLNTLKNFKDAEKPAAKKPAAKKPVTNKPVAKKPVAKKPVAQKAPVKKK